MFGRQSVCVCLLKKWISSSTDRRMSPTCSIIVELFKFLLSLESMNRLRAGIKKRALQRSDHNGPIQSASSDFKAISDSIWHAFNCRQDKAYYIYNHNIDILSIKLIDEDALVPTTSLLWPSFHSAYFFLSSYHIKSELSSQPFCILQ